MCAGLEPLLASGSIQERATRITAAVLKRCSVALLLLDARSGIIPADEALVGWLRTAIPPDTPLLLTANKAETRGRSGRFGEEWNYPFLQLQ